MQLPTPKKTSLKSKANTSFKWMEGGKKDVFYFFYFCILALYYNNNNFILLNAELKIVWQICKTRFFDKY
ncbi:hypothetical protein BpHYR1_038411 [Brachionus plicatilis]|uniref:Uncharacterized protein n=1 Tax=Brachionus plicatilis TaxID=10195 RepID=A0A3M7PDL6_BRAPC|nr:hypothetical protein BpHYR1_038411 [Brachionus plicatilis]